MSEFITQQNYNIPSSFQEHEQQISQLNPSKLKQLFTEENDTNDDVDFQYNLSHDKIPTKPPRRLSGQYSSKQKQSIVVNDPKIVTLTSDSCAVNFVEYGIRTCYVSTVNGEVIRFDDVVDGSLLTSASVSASNLTTSGNLTVLSVNDKLFCQFNSEELTTRLLAVISVKKFTDVLIFCEGVGDKEVAEDNKILYKQCAYQFINNELKSTTESGKNEHAVYLKDDKLSDPLLKHFIGKKIGAKFIVGYNGIGSFFELRRIKKKNKNSIRSNSPSSEVSEPTTPDLKNRMKNIGVRLPIVNDQTLSSDKLEDDEKIKENETLEDNYDNQPVDQSDPIKYENLTNNSSSESENNSKPIPTTRQLSTSPSVNQSNVSSSVEKRIEELEKKVTELTTSLKPESPDNFDKYCFVMDVWANIVQSTTITPETKAEIQKILLQTASKK